MYQSLGEIHYLVGERGGQRLFIGKARIKGGFVGSVAVVGGFVGRFEKVVGRFGELVRAFYRCNRQFLPTPLDLAI